LLYNKDGERSRDPELTGGKMMWGAKGRKKEALERLTSASPCGSR
jgi:hypothetical protein